MVNELVVYEVEFGGRMSRQAKLIIGSALLAVISEGVLWRMNEAGGRFIDNGNFTGVFWFCFHIPGMWIAGLVGLNGPEQNGWAPILVTFGAIQFFLIYWGTMTVLLHFAPKHSAAPGASRP